MAALAAAAVASAMATATVSPGPAPGLSSGAPPVSVVQVYRSGDGGEAGARALAADAQGHGLAQALHGASKDGYIARFADPDGARLAADTGWVLP
jgi:hypothetical protein